MKFIDMHCDTLMKAFVNQKEDIYKMDSMLDIERMQKAGQLGQFFAIFMPPINTIQADDIDDEDYITYCLKVFRHTMERHHDIIAPAYYYNDIMNNRLEGKMSGLLTLEDGRSVQSKFDNIERYYDEGIRLMTLTWNHANCFGYPNSSDGELMNKGLTSFGKEAITYMNELGMIIDVSHLSDGGFWDVVDISNRPIVASHSNARALSPHPRNLSDKMIRALADSGGIMGINFYPPFLHRDTTATHSTIALIVEHIKYIVNKAGIESVGLGSDFDGIRGEFEVASPLDMYKIFDQLSKEGFSDDVIDKIASQNALRVIKDTL